MDTANRDFGCLRALYLGENLYQRESNRKMDKAAEWGLLVFIKDVQFLDHYYYKLLKKDLTMRTRIFSVLILWTLEKKINYPVESVKYSYKAV
jgi:hypothetical protein